MLNWKYFARIAVVQRELGDNAQTSAIEDTQ